MTHQHYYSQYNDEPGLPTIAGVAEPASLAVTLTDGLLEPHVVGFHPDYLQLVLPYNTSQPRTPPTFQAVNYSQLPGLPIWGLLARPGFLI